MDFPRYIAEYIHNRTGLPAEAEPSPADIAGDHFIVKVESFWDEPEGTFSDQEVGPYSFEENGPAVEKTCRRC